MEKNKHVLSMLFALLLLLCPLASEEFYSPDWGYSIDLPEGFNVTSAQDNARYQFDHSLLPITFVIASYPLERYENTSVALESVYTSLQLQGETIAVTWSQTENKLGYFSMKASDVPYTGWAAAVELPNNKGVTVLLSYAPKSPYALYEQIMVSALDSFSPDMENDLEVGIFTHYGFPNEGDKNIEIEIGGKTIQTVLDKSDSMASDFVMQREYAILTYFAETPMWKQAWQRFYRMMYRDSYERLERVASSIYNALYEDIKKDNPQNYSRVFAQTMLSWTQGFTYERIPLGTDFTPLPAILEGFGSDCDSRALLLSVLMAQMDYNTMLFVSRDYGHAFFGIDIEGDGARLEENGINYLLGETTADVSIGLVPQDMSEISKWIAIEGL